MTSGSRDDFLRDCDAGKYNHVVAISRTFDSVEVKLHIFFFFFFPISPSAIRNAFTANANIPPSVLQMTGRFDAELISHLPPSVGFICHNGAGYDQIDVESCTERGMSPDDPDAPRRDQTIQCTDKLTALPPPPSLQASRCPTHPRRSTLLQPTRPSS